MIKKIGVIVALFMLSFSVNAQIKVTDEEIGFDREQIEKAILSNSNELLFLKGSTTEKINQLRDLYVKRYLDRIERSKNRMPPIEPPVNETCVNMDFVEGNFNGWCRYWDNYEQYDEGHNPYDDDGNGTCDLDGDIIDSGPHDNWNFTNNLRFEVIDQGNFNDPFIGTGDDFPAGVTDVVRLGNDRVYFGKDQLRQTFILSEDNSIYKFHYAAVLENPDNHDFSAQPYFKFYIEVNGNIIDCTEKLFVAGQVPDFTTVELPNPLTGILSRIQFSGWQPFIIDLSSYASDDDEVTIVLEAADCSHLGHFGYAFFSGECLSSDDGIEVESSSGEFCVDEPLVFTNTAIGTFIDEEYLWTFHDVGGPVTSTEASPIYTFNTAGSYLVELSITTSDACILEFSKTVDISPCLPEPCNDCDSFKPKPKQRYVISAWTKEDLNTQVKTYEHSSITISYLDNSDQVMSSSEFVPNGKIIEGWQRIYSEFQIPENTAAIEIILNNIGTSPNYFDDIRIHPFNGSMKSFAYDPETQRLMAELDENNYSTYYEYDNEGGLIRVKKETEKGVYTIKETRSKTSIKN
ncbi:PKD domain-containing protein [uncultured Psychroserpens sp.]|uniref:PKD domain-containing protein n=1 Tax=uncultured Psychroserpens sp. TaxID=255436 RepID=UPI00262A0BCB|nr:PKD domain-containing protein [uncultured Psychroserpens sp.]